MTAVGSSKSEAGAACEVQLPPSPEPGAHSPNSQAVPEYLTLEAGSLHESNSRLRSIAGYGSFDPRVMACSHASRPTKGVAKCRDDSSLLALAGPNGVLLTRMSRPQVPLAILSHMSSSRNQKTSISSLAFQFPSSSESLLLAAARGSGVLVWDASGHSLSPLMGRLGSDASSAVIPGQQISSLDWMKGTNPLLATSTARTACIWDVRAAIGSASSRPSLRFGSSYIPPSTESSIIQVACSRGAECATLDRSGVLRVYDIRMAGRPRSRHDNVGELSSFSAFGHIGAGLAYFSTANGRNRWVTWGLDDLRSPALVKIWSRTQTPADSKHEPDDESYWYMDGSSERSPTRPPLPNNAQKTREQYHQVAQFSTPGLACARVCPTPFGDCLVSVGVPSVARGGDLSGFDADLWKVNPDGEEECNDVTGLRVDTYGVVKIASFSGGLSNDKRLASSIGSHVKMGSLRCAELAVESTLVVSEKDSGKEDTISRNTELQLCCLSEDGFVTSYVVSSQASRMGASSASKPFSPPRRPSQRNASDETVAIFDGNQESASQDAAMAWRAWTSPSSPFLKPREIEDDPVAVKPELSPFQLDVQHAPYGAPSSEEPESLGMNIQSVAPLVSGKDGVDVGLAQMPSRTGIIDKKTVPSPRICGASFSAGMEGIVCFQNGEVRKLWAWYQKTDPQRRAHTSQTQREVPPLHATRQGGGTDHEIAYLFAGDSGVADSQETVNHHCPRTMHDLDSMTNAANDAQWKESADAIGTSDVESEDSTEILDGSTHGSSTGSDDTDEQDKSPQKGEPGEETTMDGLGPIVNMSTFVGPSADMLVPAVKVVHEHDALIFNRQSCELAEGWLLGEWQSEESERRSVESVIDASSESFRQAPSRSGSSSFAYSSGSVNAVAHLASRQSDPMLAHLTPRSPGGRKSYGVSKGDDAPVRGGEYSVRPNRQESMVFLRKLFQQQEARTLLSPPDEPLLPKKVSPPRRIASSASALQASSPTTVALDEIGAKRLDSLVGVKTITPLPGARQKREIDRRRKLNTKNICLHNSDVCVKAGQPDKANTWSLLAQLVDNVLQHDGDDFNGWNGGSRGALGRDLVENFFDYYERQGDVQMLSTMVCVLSEGQRKATAEQLSPSLLPSNSHEKHDRIIRCYADILFSWRLLTTRAELNKHLIHPLPEATREGGIDHATFDIDSGETQAPGVAIVAVCPSCNQATSPGSLLCSKCATFAFRCVMCANAVRGLFTVCWSCGHGGHTNHMLAWFKNHTTCPSGCGCTCVLSTLKDDEIK